MASLAACRAPSLGRPTGSCAAPFVIALNDRHGTALRLRRIATGVEGVNGAGGAVSHLVNSANEIRQAAECLLEAARGRTAEPIAIPRETKRCRAQHE
jgi:hypothetical protein